VTEVEEGSAERSLALSVDMMAAVEMVAEAKAPAAEVMEAVAQGAVVLEAAASAEVGMALVEA
jgi:hypothetical protein